MEIKCKQCHAVDEAYILEVWSCYKCGSLDYEVLEDKEYAFDYSDCFM